MLSIYSVVMIYTCSIFMLEAKSFVLMLSRTFNAQSNHLTKEKKLIHSSVFISKPRQNLGECTHQEDHGSASLDEQITPKDRGKYASVFWTVCNPPGLVCEESVPEAEDVRKRKLLQSK